MHTRTLVALIAVSLVLAGCGGTTASKDVPEDSTDASAEVAATTASEITSTSVGPDRSTTTTAANATSVDEAVEDEDTAEDDVDDEASRDDARDEDSTPPETVPTTEPGDGVTGEVPEAFLDAVLVDASNTTGMAITELTVLRAEYVEWSDGSLGCPEPGVVYTQAKTPGYWVEIGAGERVLDYRLGENGFFTVCGGTATPHNTGSTQPGGDS